MTDIRIRDVTPRDGLQDIKQLWPLAQKVELLGRLFAAGVTWVEATSFVNPKVVPQLADAAELVSAIRMGSPPDTLVSAFAATPRGAERALAAGVGEISTAVPATDGMSWANFHRTTADMVGEASAIRELDPSLPMSATIAVAFGCPFDGRVSVTDVVPLAERLADAGYRTLFLGDTVGVGDPKAVTDTVRALRTALPECEIGLHMHDPRGSAVANVVAGLDAGASIVDAAAGGLGGCPFAPGAAGNVAAEDVVWALEAIGYRTGLDPFALADVARWIRDDTGTPIAGNLANVKPFEWESPAPVVS